MAEDVDAEIRTLQEEYNWLLSVEVHGVLEELKALLAEGCRKFPVQINTEENSVAKAEKFVLSSADPNTSLKCMVTLMADHVSEADLTLKIKKQQTCIINTKIYPDMPWRVQQIQDAGNHLLLALSKIEEYDDHQFSSGQEVLKLLDDLMSSLQRGRSSLALPKKRTLEDLVRNPALKAFKPQLPTNTIVSFYVQAQKLILAVYFLYVNSSQKIDIQSRQQVECTVPWLNDALVLFTLALQLCQTLREKLSVFIQYQAEAKFQPHVPRLDLQPPALSVETSRVADCAVSDILGDLTAPTSTTTAAAPPTAATDSSNPGHGTNIFKDQLSLNPLLKSTNVIPHNDPMTLNTDLQALRGPSTDGCLLSRPIAGGDGSLGGGGGGRRMPAEVKSCKEESLLSSANFVNHSVNSKSNDIDLLGVTTKPLIDL